MKPKVLFLCTGNSCRSQMAEAFLRKLKGDKFEAYSAGLNPTNLDPMAVKVMNELGIDISGHSPKDINEVSGLEFDYVITLCDNAAQMCPYFPAKKKFFHKGFDDPPLLAAHAKSENEILEIYRRVRDEIMDFVQGIEQYLAETSQVDTV